MATAFSEGEYKIGIHKESGVLTAADCDRIISDEINLRRFSSRLDSLQYRKDYEL